jgi:hypothetical protein
MFRFILYALLFVLVIQMIRTTTRIRSNAKRSGDEEEKKKPVINIPDIQEARFEDITGKEEDGKPGEKPDGTPPH